jgi:hypothetical protein
MTQISRFSLMWYMLWAALVVTASALSQANSAGQEPIAAGEELIQEIESLEVINDLNSGALDAGQVAVRGEGRGTKEVQAQANHLATPRSMLSQR